MGGFFICALYCSADKISCKKPIISLQAERIYDVLLGALLKKRYHPPKINAAIGIEMLFFIIKIAAVFCKQLGINYDKLSKDEFVSLINILKKSSLLKGQPNKRGKNKPKRK